MEMTNIAKRLLASAVLLAGVLTSVTSAADVIRLKNGNTLEGEIIATSEREVTIDILGVGKLTIRQAEIASIEEPSDHDELEARFATEEGKERWWNELKERVRMLHQQDHLEEAIKVVEEAVPLAEQAYGPEHPRVAEVLNNLGRLYRNQGQHAKAEPLHKHALAIYERSLGSEHDYVDTTLVDLVQLYVAQSNLAEAEAMYQRLLALREKQLGPEHGDVASVLDDLGVMYLRQGQPDKAEPLLTRALAVFEKTVEPDDKRLVAVLGNLAHVYYDQEKWAEAESVLNRMLPIYEKKLSPNDLKIGQILESLARVSERQGKYADAASLYERALAIEKKVLGENHPDVVKLSERFSALLEKKAWEEIRPALEASQAEARATYIGRWEPRHAWVQGNGLFTIEYPFPWTCGHLHHLGGGQPPNIMGALLLMMCTPHKDAALTVGLSSHDVSGVELDAFVQQYIENVKQIKQVKGDEILGEVTKHPTTVSGFEAKQLSFDVKAGDGEHTRQQWTVVLFFVDRYALTVQYGALKDEFEKYRPFFEKMVGSLKIFPQAIEATLTGKEDQTAAIQAMLSLQGLEFEPENEAAIPHVKLADSYTEQGRFQEAEAEYRKALAEHPRNVKAHVGLGVVYENYGRFEEALAQYQKAVDLEPALRANYERAYVGIGNVSAKLERDEQAIEAYHQAIAHDPESVDAHYGLANVLERQGRCEEAKANYQKVVELQPTSHHTYQSASLGLGNCLLAQGEHAGAIQSYEQVLSRNAQSTDAYYAIAWAYDQWGKPEKAIEYYEAALRVDPNFARAWWSLAYVYFKRGEYQACEEALNKALAREPNNPDFKASLAQLKAVQGR
jgi:tetratricopeptide (TPR) repeat protein